MSSSHISSSCRTPYHQQQHQPWQLPPAQYKHLQDKRKAKQMKIERDALIEHENLALLSSLQSILHRKQVDNLPSAHPAARGSRAYAGVGGQWGTQLQTMNRRIRTRQLTAIALNNEKIVQRIIAARPRVNFPSANNVKLKEYSKDYFHDPHNPYMNWSGRKQSLPPSSSSSSSPTTAAQSSSHTRAQSPQQQQTRPPSAVHKVPRPQSAHVDPSSLFAQEPLLLTRNEPLKFAPVRSQSRPHSPSRITKEQLVATYWLKENKHKRPSTAPRAPPPPKAPVPIQRRRRAAQDKSDEPSDNSNSSSGCNDKTNAANNEEKTTNPTPSFIPASKQLAHLSATISHIPCTVTVSETSQPWRLQFHVVCAHGVFLLDVPFSTLNCALQLISVHDATRHKLIDTLMRGMQFLSSSDGLQLCVDIVQPEPASADDDDELDEHDATQQYTLSMHNDIPTLSQVLSPSHALSPPASPQLDSRTTSSLLPFRGLSVLTASTESAHSSPRISTQPLAAQTSTSQVITHLPPHAHSTTTHNNSNPHGISNMFVLGRSAGDHTSQAAPSRPVTSHDSTYTRTPHNQSPSFTTAPTASSTYISSPPPPSISSPPLPSSQLSPSLDTSLDDLNISALDISMASPLPTKQEKTSTQVQTATAATSSSGNINRVSEAKPSAKPADDDLQELNASLDDFQIDDAPL